MHSLDHRVEGMGVEAKELPPERFTGHGIPEPDVFGFSIHTGRAAQEAASMARPQKTAKRHKPKTILRFPDLEHSKNAGVNSLAAANTTGMARTYQTIRTSANPI
jgi:hypothetical protein